MHGRRKQSHFLVVGGGGGGGGRGGERNIHRDRARRFALHARIDKVSRVKYWGVPPPPPPPHGSYAYEMMYVVPWTIDTWEGLQYEGAHINYLIMVGAQYACECASAVMATVCSWMSWVTLTVILVLGSYNWTQATGQTCTISGIT